MELTVHERLLLRNILPQHGVPFGTLALSQKLNNSLFTDDEWKDLEVKQHFECPECGALEKSVEVPMCPNCNKRMKGNGQVTWRLSREDGSEVPQVKDISIGDKARKLIIDQLENLEEAGNASVSFLTLWEKFSETD